ncbi:MAG: hypothetical protein IJA39_03660 [Clostridia bacterium]|nr:hypothetical protein [Clostridia bacterium]
MNKKIITALVCLLTFTFVFSACKPVLFTGLGGTGTTAPVNQGGNLPQYEYQTSAPAIIPENTMPTLPDVNVPSSENVQTTVPSVPSTEPSTVPPVSEPPKTDYSAYSKAQIISTYAEALQKTRAFTGNLTVDHTEAFTADIKEANPGGALTELLASNIVKLVGSEGQQTLSYSGGKATNADGESVPILLPQRTSFSLPEEGVKSATISEENGMVHITLTLIPETVSMGQVPKYNSTSIGYLDTSDMDFKIITISRVDIGYTGSVIDAYIRPDGYISSVNYTINMSTYAELSGMGITGYGVLEGAQTEKWKLNW